MRRLVALVFAFGICASLLAAAPPQSSGAASQAGAGAATLTNATSATTPAVRSQWEEKFRAIPLPANQRRYMERLSARPHHVGSAYDKENAEWLASTYKSWGLDAQIESFSVL